MAGIYHNATLGVISLSSDGSNWITIADKNLGATTVWNYGDALSEANGGKHYQRGNNYGFPYSGTLSSTSSERVDVTGYGPGNYYNSSTFITSNQRFSSNNYKNLWGLTTGTLEAMQGPCSSGYHIPLSSEWQNIFDIGIDIGAWVDGGAANIETYLKLPEGGRIYYPTGEIQPSSVGLYWSNSFFNDGGSPQYFRVYNGQTYVGYDSPAMGFSIRPFKNETVVPYANEGWTKLYGDDLSDRPKLKRLQNGGNYYYFKDAPTHASAISLNKSSITLTEAGQTEQLVATITPSDAIDKSIIWTSSNEAVARVSSNGLVSCVTPGDCTITATTNDGSYTATCSIYMIHVTGVSLNTNSINLSTAGQTYQLTATITPNDATNKNVTWTSSNTAIATVSSTGLVTCVTPGSATITVTTEDGGYTASCNVYKTSFQPGTDAYIYMPLTSTTQLQDLGTSGKTFTKRDIIGYTGDITYNNLGATFNNALIESSSLGQTQLPYTISFWANANSSSSAAFLFNYFDGSSSYYIGYRVYTGGGTLYIEGGDGSIGSISRTMQLNSWHLYTMRNINENGTGKMYFYIDGILIGNKNGYSPNEPIYIGGVKYSNGNYAASFDGTISDFFIYKEDLGEDKIQYYYETTKSRYGL